MRPEKIHISIVEDDQEIRENLSYIIDRSPGYDCLATYDCAEKAIEEMRYDTPDVVLMDISLPGMSGIEGVRQLKAQTPSVEVIMLTVHQDNQLVFDSLCAGACGYLTKHTSPQRILDAIQEVHAGGAPMSTDIARMVVGSFQRKHRHDLTRREKEVLEQLCQGKSYKMIADVLFISQDTVRSHIKSIYKKLTVNSKSEAVAKALRNNWV